LSGERESEQFRTICSLSCKPQKTYIIFQPSTSPEPIPASDVMRTKVMDPKFLVPVVVAAVVIIVIAALLVIRKRKSDQLKQRFGSEYDRLAQQQGGTRHAEDVLAQREKRVEKFAIRALPAGDRERYAQEWGLVQKRFVDDPSAAVTEADQLVTTVMGARGYPMVDFEQRAADVSVNYPAVVQNYRSAREIVLRHGKGQSTTEDLRQAMVYFRSLFEELLDSPKPEKIGVSHERIAS
jgi:hypothetical protein